MKIDLLKVVIDAETSGLRAALNAAKRELEGLSADASRIGAEVDAGLNQGSKAASKFAGEVESGSERITDATSKVNESISSINSTLNNVAGSASNSANNIQLSFDNVNLSDLQEQLQAAEYNLLAIEERAHLAAEALNMAQRNYDELAKQLLGIGIDSDLIPEITTNEPERKALDEARAAYEAAREEIEAQKKTISELTGKIHEAANAAGEYKKQMAGATDAVNETAESVKNVTKEVKKSDEVTKKSNLFGNNLGSRIKTILFYRTLRSIISAITRSVKETIGYLAVYDKKLNGIAGYNKTLSQLYSNLTKLQTTFGITVMSFLTTLAPVLNALMNVLTWLFERINELMAALQGKKTYTAANPEYWEDYAEKVKESNSELKETKKLLSGFDELNIFSKNQASIFDSDTPLFIEKEVTALGALAGLWPLLIPIIKKIVDLFKKKNSALGEQTTKTIAETTAASALGKAFGAVAASAAAVAAAIVAIPAVKQVAIQIAAKGAEVFEQIQAKIAEINSTVVQPVIRVVSESFMAGVQAVKQVLAEIGQTVVTPVIEIAVTGVENAIAAIQKLATSAGEIAVQVKETIGNAFSGAMEYIGTVMTNIIANVSANLQQAAAVMSNFITTTAANFAQWQSNVLNTIGNWATSAFSIIGTWSVQAATTMATALENIKQNFITWGTQVVTIVVNTFNAVSQNIATAFVNIINNVSTFISSTYEGIVSWCTAAFNTFKSWGTQVIQTVGNVLVTAMLKVVSWCQEALSKIGSVFSKIGDTVSTSVSNVGSWMKNAVSDVGEWIGDHKTELKIAGLTAAAAAVTAAGVALAAPTGGASAVGGAAVAGEITAAATVATEAAAATTVAAEAAAASATAATAAAAATEAIAAGAGTAATTGATIISITDLLSKVGTGAAILIPAAASGAVATSETLLRVGEYPGAKSNPEIITPQNIMKETMDSSNGLLAEVITQCTRQVIASIENMDMEVSIGDDVIAKSAARGNNNYKRMTGKALISA